MPFSASFVKGFLEPRELKWLESRESQQQLRIKLLKVCITSKKELCERFSSSLGKLASLQQFLVCTSSTAVKTKTTFLFDQKFKLGFLSDAHNRHSTICCRTF